MYVCDKEVFKKTFVKKLNSFKMNNGFLLFGTAILGSLAIFKWRGRGDKHKKVVVSEIVIYPIKSCRGIRILSSKLTKRGFEYDRIFMLVDEKNNFVSQRTHPKLALIEVKLDGEYLVTNAPGMECLQIPLGTETLLLSPQIEVTVWGDICHAYDMGEQYSSWFCKYLDSANIRLVRYAEDFRRPTDPKYAPGGEVTFSDGYPLLLASEESLTELQSRLVRYQTNMNSTSPPIPQPSHVSTSSIKMENFRPNIVVRGYGQPFAEDSWKDISFVNSTSNSLVTIRIVKPCSRCKIPSIDTDKGTFDPSNTVTKVLKTFRTGTILRLSNKKWGGEVFFAQNAIPLLNESSANATISVGDFLTFEA